MKLFLRDDKGNEIEIEKAQSLSEGDIVLKSNRLLRDTHRYALEKHFSEKFNRKVVIVDGMFDEILIVPPIK